MNRLFVAAGMLAVGCAAPMEAGAQSCPAGQILRVSMGVCQPKSSSNVWASKGDRKPAVAPSTATPAVGDVVLFGSTGPKLLKSATAKPLKKAPKTASAAAKAPAPRKAVVAVAAVAPNPPASITTDSELRKRVHAFMAQSKIADPKVEEALVTEARKAETKPEAAPEAAAEIAPPDRQTAALESAGEAPTAPMTAPDIPAPQLAPAPVAAVEAAPAAKEAATAPQAAPPALPEPRPTAPAPASLDQTGTTMAAVERPKNVRTIPLYQTPEPALPAATNSSLPDWGDEKKLVEALRANWTTKPVERTFQLGEEVPADIPLKPLPAPFASRDTGVNMHYLISNGDAVLVLPGTRVVVDVYHSATASLR